MDIKREGVVKRKRIRTAGVTLLVLGAASAAARRISQIKPAVPAVERATLLIDTVKHGDITIEVRGIGTLVPEEIVWIPALFDSQISKILVKSGQTVKPSTILLVLDNPDMQLAAGDLEWQIRQAEAAYSDLRVRLQSQRLDQQANLAAVASEVQQAQLTKDRDQQLLSMGLKSDLEVRLSVAKWEQLQGKHGLEQQRLDIMGESVDAQLDAQKVQIEKLRAALTLKRRQVRDLTVRAGTSGVIQEVTLQVGQRVTPGTVLAKVAEPRNGIAVPRLDLAAATAAAEDRSRPLGSVQIVSGPAAGSTRVALALQAHGAVDMCLSNSIFCFSWILKCWETRISTVLKESPQ